MWSKKIPPVIWVGTDEKKMGQKGSSTNPLIFDRCRIPKENLLGSLDDGFRISLMELAGGRIGIGSMSIGIGRAAMDFAVDYAKSREQFGQPISHFQAIQWMIADSYTELSSGPNAGFAGRLSERNRKTLYPGGLHGQTAGLGSG